MSDKNDEREDDDADDASADDSDGAADDDAGDDSEDDADSDSADGADDAGAKKPAESEDIVDRFVGALDDKLTPLRDAFASVDKRFAKLEKQVKELSNVSSRASHRRTSDRQRERRSSSGDTSQDQSGRKPATSDGERKRGFLAGWLY